MASQITGISMVYSTICSGADQSKHHKGPVKRMMFPVDDVIMRDNVRDRCLSDYLNKYLCRQCWTHRWPTPLRICNLVFCASCFLMCNDELKCISLNWNDNAPGRNIQHPGGPFYYYGLTLIPACVSNHSYHKVWDVIIYPLPNLNGVTVEVWEWISNFIPQSTGHVITYPCWDYN